MSLFLDGVLSTFPRAIMALILSSQIGPHTKFSLSSQDFTYYIVHLNFICMRNNHVMGIILAVIKGVSVIGQQTRAVLTLPGSF